MIIGMTERGQACRTVDPTSLQVARDEVADENLLRERGITLSGR